MLLSKATYKVVYIVHTAEYQGPEVHISNNIFVVRAEEQSVITRLYQQEHYP